MNTIPITKLTIYRHGLGYYERRANVLNNEITLSFNRQFMNDILKSLTVIDWGKGQVLGISYPTPPMLQQTNSPINIPNSGDDDALVSFIKAIIGKRVKIFIGEPGKTISYTSHSQSTIGTILGLSRIDANQPLATAMISILRDNANQITLTEVGKIAAIEVYDDGFITDLRYHLKSINEHDECAIKISLNEEEHDISIRYITTAPPWRVSYRVMVENDAEKKPMRSLLLGLAIFDNHLEEDLQNVSISFATGSPSVSHDDLYQPMNQIGIEQFFNDNLFPTQNQEKEVEDPFVYTIDQLVSVPRGKTAILSILSVYLPCRKVLIYHHKFHNSHPSKSLRLINHSGFTLERGTATIIENNEFLGEAIVPHTANGEDVLLTYALEPQVRVEISIKNREEIQGVGIENGSLVSLKWEVIQTDYSIHNHLSDEAMLLIEHEAAAAFELFDSATPVAHKEQWCTFDIILSPQVERVFKVQERHLLSQKIALLDLTLDDLRPFVKHGVIESSIQEKLNELLELKSEYSITHSRVDELTNDYEKEIIEQARIRNNLQSIHEGELEGTIRSAFIQQLWESEKRFDQMGKRKKELHDSLVQQKSEIEMKIKLIG